MRSKRELIGKTPSPQPRRHSQYRFAVLPEDKRTGRNNRILLVNA